MAKDIRDISNTLKKIREFLLGRKHTPHFRHPPDQAPRTIPPADVPRGPSVTYHDQYYCKRSAMNSVRPPVVTNLVGPAGPGHNKSGTINLDEVCFVCPPTPGPVWWWDGHCYY